MFYQVSTGCFQVNEECPVMRCARLEAKVKTFKEERMVAKTSILCNAEYDVAYFLLDVGTAAWFIYFAWVTTRYAPATHLLVRLPACSLFSLGRERCARSNGSCVLRSFRNSQSTAPAGNEMAPVGSSVGHGM